ncbi:NACHT domain-containing protein [Roseibium sp.]|uniref:NACHT domain-containing protein n=1 Tax=Roseibium sp. TaxID=1936156 RepID=UPI003A9787C7
MKKNIAGGAATASGINYQAAVAALGLTHIATGRWLPWLGNLSTALPLALSAETSGGGDDFRIDLSDKSHLEVQVKRGLARGAKLWSALEALAKSIVSDPLEFGLLIVCDSSSQTIRKELSRDIIRMGDGRFDNLKGISLEFKQKLENSGLKVRDVCSRLRVVTVDATELTSPSVQTAIRDLEDICKDKKSAESAWSALYIDSGKIIETKGRRDLISIGRVLGTNAIDLGRDSSQPVSFIASVAQWIVTNNSDLIIPGMTRPLALEEAWIKTSVKVQEAPISQATSDLAEALERYHGSVEATRNDSSFDIEWLGRFVPHLVLIGGPGAGKSTAAKVIARKYGLDGFPVLSLRLPRLATRLQRGDGLWEAMLALGLDGSGVNRNDASPTFPWVIIADGLDECGFQKAEIAAELTKFSNSHPHIKIIVTTRPIGYDVPHFHAWRHYRMLAQDDSNAGQALSDLVGLISNGSVTIPGRLHRLDGVPKDLSNAIKRTPLILVLSAVLLADGRPFQKNRAAQYSAIIERIQKTNAPRADDGGMSESVLNYVLNLIGEHSIAFPLSDSKSTTEFVTGQLSVALGTTELKAQDFVQKAVEYWTDVGLLERVSHGDQELLTFIHRTFAEFSSARFLVESIKDSQKRDELLSERMANSKWEEVVEFVSMLGWGDAVVSRLLADFEITSVCAPKVAQSLRIAAFGNQNLSNEVLSLVFQHSSELSMTGRRDLVTLIATPLIDAAARYQDYTRSIGQSLANSQFIWSRLLGHSLLLANDPSPMEVANAQDELLQLRVTIEEDKPELTTGFIAIDKPSPVGLIEAFVVRLIDQLALTLPKPELIEAVAPIVELRDKYSLGFYEAISKCFQRHEIHEQVKKADFGISGFDKNWIENFSTGFKDNLLGVFSPITSLLTVGQRKVIIPSVEENFLYVSAILQITGFWNMTLHEVAGAGSGELAAAEQETMRCFVHAAGIPLDSLVSEVAALENQIKQQADLSARLFERTVRVDCDLPDWHSIATPPADLNKLEKCVRESSYWMARIATALIEDQATESEREEITRRALSEDGYYAVALASHLALSLPKDKSLVVLMEAAGGERKHVGPVLDALSKVTVWNKSLLEVCRIHLLSADVENAAAAASLMLEIAAPQEPSVIELSREGYEYWLEHEEPYPVKGGTVPTSPRDSLVKLVELQSWSDKDIFQAITDPRTDVRNFSVQIMIKQLGNTNSARCLFVELCINEKLSQDTVRTVLKSTPPFNEYEVKELSKLLKNKSPRWRYVGLELLRPEYMKSHEALAVIDEMVDETVPEIIAGLEQARQWAKNQAA